MAEVAIRNQLAKGCAASQRLSRIRAWSAGCGGVVCLAGARARPDGLPRWPIGGPSPRGGSGSPRSRFGRGLHFPGDGPRRLKKLLPVKTFARIITVVSARENISDEFKLVVFPCPAEHQQEQSQGAIAEPSGFGGRNGNPLGMLAGEENANSHSVNQELHHGRRFWLCAKKYAGRGSRR